SSSEISGDHAGHSVPTGDKVSVTIGVHDVDVVYNCCIVYNRRIVDHDRSARSIPGTIDFARCQRHPADIVPPSEKHHERRTPVIADARLAGIPDPTETRSVIPPAIVIRSPAPGIAAHPGPAIEIHPDPPANAIGRPPDANRRHPYPAVRRIVDPSAMTVQILGAMDMTVHVFVTVAAIVIPIARVVPAIPVVARNSPNVGLFRIGRIAIHNKSLTRAEPVGFATNINLSLT